MPLKGNVLVKKAASEAVAFEVGGAAEAKCGKCKKQTKHTILALEAEKPSKVRCTICEAEHKYRPPAKPRVAKAPGATRKNAEAQEWAKLSPEWDEGKAVAYATTGTFKKNSLINHPNFGVGMVQQLVEPNKMRVLFETGVKTMLCTI